MSIPSPLRDHLFVQVDTAGLDRTETGLYIPDWQPGDKDAKKATVVAVPVSLSRERQLPYPGMDGRAYTFADLPELPAVGETVYLEPNTFKPELEYPGHPGVFLVSLDKVIAVAGPAGLRPYRGLLLCEEVWGKDVHVRVDGVRERWAPRPKGQLGVIVVETNPLPEQFTLRIIHVSPPLRGQEDVVREGDTIIAHRMLFAYHPVKQADDEEVSARWMWQPPKVVIEGKEYAYVPRQCVMGKQKWFTQSWPKSTRAVTNLASPTEPDEWGLLQDCAAKPFTVPPARVDESEVHTLTFPSPRRVGVPRSRVKEMRPILESIGYAQDAPTHFLPLTHPAYNA